MARIRTIKPEMYQDEKLSPLPVLTRFVFHGLISMADDAGRVLDNVRLIDAFLFPETDDTCRESLATLAGIGRIKRGVTASGQRVIQIVNWTKHQKVDHPNLKAALPEIVEEVEVTPIREARANPSRPPREPVAHHTNDQRPTTNDLSVADAPGNWPAEAAAIWQDTIGILPPARFGRALKSAVKQFGWATSIGTGPPVRDVFRVYCKWRPYQQRNGAMPTNADNAIRDVRFASPEEFARTYTEWAGWLKPLEGQAA